jgi:hypothetical protein
MHCEKGTLISNDKGKEDAAMSKYTPEKLVAVSRYQSYFPTLPGDIQSDAYTRIAELMEEEKKYCDILGRAFRNGGDGNDIASCVGLRVQAPAAVSCAGTV